MMGVGPSLAVAPLPWQPMTTLRRSRICCSSDGVRARRAGLLWTSSCRRRITSCRRGRNICPTSASSFPTTRGAPARRCSLSDPDRADESAGPPVGYLWPGSTGRTRWAGRRPVARRDRWGRWGPTGPTGPAEARCGRSRSLSAESRSRRPAVVMALAVILPNVIERASSSSLRAHGAAPSCSPGADAARKGKRSDGRDVWLR